MNCEEKVMKVLKTRLRRGKVSTWIRSFGSKARCKKKVKHKETQGNTTFRSSNYDLSHTDTCAAMNQKEFGTLNTKNTPCRSLA